MLSCPYKYLTGIDCPGCGFQRALLSLIKGEFLESILYYPALIPLLIMALYLILHLIFRFSKGAFFLKSLFIVNSFIISFNYILNLLNNHG